jgi:hypothetical protein
VSEAGRGGVDPRSRSNDVVALGPLVSPDVLAYRQSRIERIRDDVAARVSAGEDPGTFIDTLAEELALSPLPVLAEVLADPNLRSARAPSAEIEDREDRQGGRDRVDNAHALWGRSERLQRSLPPGSIDVLDRRAIGGEA